MKTLFQGVYSFDKFIATINAVPGRKVYDERLVKAKLDTGHRTPDTGYRTRDTEHPTRDTELRVWDPFRSKLAAAIKKGLRNFPFPEGCKVLYLGASTGTTVSHLSDIIGPRGEIFAVEIAPQCMKSLLALCDVRENIIPINADANQPQEYGDVGKVDSLYMDVAQPNQAEILAKNADMFLKKGGIAMIAIKSQSIDVTKSPKEVFGIVLKELEPKFDVLERYELEPFDKDHLFVVLRFRGVDI